MKYSSVSILSCLFAATQVVADVFVPYHTFTLLTLHSGTNLQFENVAVNDDSQLVVDVTLPTLTLDYQSSGTVVEHNTSVYLTVSSDNRLVLGTTPTKWEVVGGNGGSSSGFTGSFEFDPSIGFLAVPYANGKGYDLYTSNYKPAAGVDAISFQMMPEWNNYTATLPAPGPDSTLLPHTETPTSVPAESTVNPGGPIIHTAYTTITHHLSPSSTVTVWATPETIHSTETVHYTTFTTVFACQ